MSEQNMMLEQYMDIGSRLSEKWNFLVEGVSDEYTRNTTSILLENTLQKVNDQTNGLIKEGFETGDVTGINRILLPVIRRVYPHLMANEFVTVQPMLTPTTQIFYLRYRYGASSTSLTGQKTVNAKGETRADDELLRVPAYGDFGLNPYYSSQVIKNHPVLDGSDELVLYSGGSDFSSPYSQTVQWTPVIAGTINLKLVEFTDETVTAYTTAAPTGTSVTKRTYGDVVHQASIGTDGTTITNVTGTGSTIFAGSTYVAGTPNGTLSVAITYEGTADLAVVFDYEYNQENNANIPEMKIAIQTDTITAKERKLKTEWTQEAMQDLKALHNIDAEAEITSVISSMLIAEIDREILSDLLNNAGVTDTFNYTDDSTNNTGGNFLDRNQALAAKVIAVSSEIHRLGKLGAANWVVTSPNIGAKLRATRGFESANEGKYAEFNMGIALAGSISGGNLKIYVDPYFPKNKILLGYKGNSFLATSYVYAPYQPLYTTPLIYDPATLKPVRGFLTRYGKKLVVGGEYLLGRITVSNVD